MGYVRRNFLVPAPRMESFEALNAHLERSCLGRAVQVMAHNLARWTARIGLGERIVTTKTLRRRFFALAGRLTRSARRLPPCIFPSAGPGRSSSAAPWPGCQPFHSQPDGARPPLTRRPTQRPRKLAPAQSASASCHVLLSRHLARHSHCRPPSVPPKRLQTARQPSRLPKFKPGLSRL